MQIDFALLSDRMKHWAVLAVCASIFSYFLIHSVMGENGMITMAALKQDVAHSRLQLQSMQKERMAMENRTRLLRPDSLDLDMLDERARALLGYTKPNEYVIYYNKK